MSRYIFLDIDGVLATNGTYARWYAAGGGPMDALLDRPRVARLDAFAREWSAGIVLSTAWRFLSPPVAGRLQAAGLTAPIVGETPRLGRGPCSPGRRGHEISRYMLDHGIAPGSVIIFDDDETAGDALPGAPRQSHRWVRTEMVHGLTARHLRRAEALFMRTAAAEADGGGEAGGARL